MQFKQPYTFLINIPLFLHDKDVIKDIHIIINTMETPNHEQGHQLQLSSGATHGQTGSESTLHTLAPRYWASGEQVRIDEAFSPAGWQHDSPKF